MRAISHSNHRPDASPPAGHAQILTCDFEDTGAVIRNVFPGCNPRGCTNALRQADNLQITYPPQCSVDMRAVLLATGILADYLFFANRPRLPLPLLGSLFDSADSGAPRASKGD